MSIRGRLTLFFVAFALVAIGLTSIVSVAIVRNRAMADAHQAFITARAQLATSLRLRYQTFENASTFSSVQEVVRQVTTYKDKADYGFGSPEEDLARRKQLHDDLADANWEWTGTRSGSFFALTDYKGRVIYASTSRQAWGSDALTLKPVAQAYDTAGGFRGAGVVRSDDPALVALGPLPDSPTGAFVVFAAATAPSGVAAAAFVQGVSADHLLRDVALEDHGTLLELVGDDGGGGLPPAVRAAGLALADDAVPIEVRDGGTRWLVQRFPLTALDSTTPIATVLVARDLDVGLEVLNQVPLLLAVAALLPLGLALALATVIGERLTRPIVELEGAARQVAAGNLDTTVPVQSTDEIGRLGAAFNQMTEGLRERDRIKRTFKKYLAPEVVDYLLTHPEAQALGGQRRELTVLFSDLAGFTTLAESLEPEAVIGLLNEYFTEVSRRVVERGGTIDKYIGDAIMAFFGAPVPRPEHAAAACLSALDHIEALRVLSARWGRDVLSVRVGLNTGEMIVGNIGGEQGQDYTVIGDAVNLGSRLEGVNKEYGTRIIASESTIRAAGAKIESRELDRVRVKGKTLAVGIYEVLGERGKVARGMTYCTVHYAKGLASLRARDFAWAVIHFEAALAVMPGDGPSATMLERARAFSAAPPPPDWDGVHTLSSK